MDQGIQVGPGPTPAAMEVPTSRDTIFVEESVIEAVREILAVARKNLQEYGTHLPTAILHCIDGMFPIVLPFKDNMQKKALVEFVKDQAKSRDAFAVTMVTCATITDSRSGVQEEALTLATAIQGGRPHFMVQRYARGPDRSIIAFGECDEGEDAAMPGQMLIIPAWEDEVEH